MMSEVKMNREELLKNAKPILFNTQMVQAILEGRKTVTRRVIKRENILPTGDWLGEIREGGEWCTNPRKDVLWTGFRSEYGADAYYMCRYQVGDILWVRETWYYEEHLHNLTAGEPNLPNGKYLHRYVYKADNPDYSVNIGVGKHGWKPSIFMPKEAARIFLKVTDVRIERVQDITEQQAFMEGFRIGDKHAGENSTPALTPKQSFMWYWDLLNSKREYTWALNPWVWVIEFKKCEITEV